MNAFSICIPVREAKAAKALNRLHEAEKHADFLELWLDQFSEDVIKTLIKKARKPVIAVCRGPMEKGSFHGSEEERVERLILAIKSGAKFVDLGFQTSSLLTKPVKNACGQHHSKLIISQHFWKETPALDRLKMFVKKAKARGADVIKVAASVRQWSDNVILFELTRWAISQGLSVIVVGMGEKGKISRLGCPILGSFLTYVALNETSKTAPGQPTLAEFRNLVFNH